MLNRNTLIKLLNLVGLRPLQGPASKVAAASYIVSTDEIKIAMRYSRPAAKIAVMFVAGYGGDQLGTKATFINDLASKMGLECMRFDYRGVGESEGDFKQATLGNWFSDALTAFDRIEADKKILVGSSMGGWVSLLLARVRPIDGLILIAPAPDFPRTLLEPILSKKQSADLKRKGIAYMEEERDDSPPLYITKRFIQESEKFYLLGKKKPKIKLECPVSILHGDEDDVVPLEHSQKVRDQIVAPKIKLTEVDGGDHRLSRDDDLVILEKEIRAIVKRLNR